MSKKIEIQRNHKPTPVAYFSPSSGAVYWPGQDGKSMNKEGRTTAVNYSGIDFETIGDYEPLYSGDVIRIISEETITL